MAKMKSNTGLPLVSVIMPTYNHAKFIGQAIESALSQTYKYLELIVIDNYSEDNTELIVTSYRDNRIRYIKFRNNGIIAASRNLGIKTSKGEYIAFLDSDDVWIPYKLEKQVSIMEAYEDIGLVYSRIKIISRNSVQETLGQRGRSGCVFEKLMKGNFISACSVIVRREVLTDIGFYEEDPLIIGGEDYELWTRIACKYKIYYIDEVLCKYRLHPGCKLGNNKVKDAELNLWVLHSIMKKLSMPEKLKKEALEKSYVNLALVHGLSGDLRQFLFYKQKTLELGFNLKLWMISFLLSTYGHEKSLRIYNRLVGIYRKMKTYWDLSL